MRVIEQIINEKGGWHNADCSYDKKKYLTQSELYATVCFERAVMVWILQKPVSSIMTFYSKSNTCD